MSAAKTEPAVQLGFRVVASCSRQSRPRSPFDEDHALLSALLLTGAAGIAAQAYAAEDGPALLSRDACTTVRHELDAIDAHLRESQANPRDSPPLPTDPANWRSP
ncbi:hypothetical protein [Thauera humireducens]|uniref:hypothetical protein n=1 Tax=Thauera humireducens TaxID=1134435 RepID=UPI00311DAD20